MEVEVFPKGGLVPPSAGKFLISPHSRGCAAAPHSRTQKLEILPQGQRETALVRAPCKKETAPCWAISPHPLLRSLRTQGSLHLKSERLVPQPGTQGLCRDFIRLASAA